MNKTWTRLAAEYGQLEPKLLDRLTSNTNDLPETVENYMAADTRRYHAWRDCVMWEYNGCEWFQNLDDIPDTLTLYRGSYLEADTDGVQPFSWTADIGVALWFASRHTARKGRTGVVYKVEVPKDHIVCVIGGPEREVLVDYEVADYSGTLIHTLDAEDANEIFRMGSRDVRALVGKTDLARIEWGRLWDKGLTKDKNYYHWLVNEFGVNEYSFC